MKSPEVLPVSNCLPELVAAVEQAHPVVLRAPPGAGKTTGVPPALLDAGLLESGQLLLVQPRRLAARTAASRLAHLTGSKLGDRVGYHVRFDRCCSADTKLLVMTTGILLRRLQSDPLLEDVQCVLLDEFHERSLELDLALGMLHRIRSTLRPEVKLVVMSATLDPLPIQSFLGQEAIAITSQGRSYPVDVRHTNGIASTPLEEQVAAVLPEALRESHGHLLVFLPGLGEIRRVARRVRQSVSGEADIYELYGDLPPRAQDHVLQDTGRRKIILSTNVAETSITIPGVTAVIDSGLVRMMRFDSHVGLPRLQLEPNSQASADQRAGRAGRTEPGIAYRLWPANAHRARPASDPPEVERADLSGAVLTLAGWGERDVFEFPWLTPPPAGSVEKAIELLTQLDAITPEKMLTPVGRQMIRLPIHPRMARFLLSAAETNRVDDAAMAAALLTERDPFKHDVTASRSHGSHRCDISGKVERLNAFFAGRSDRGIDAAGARRLRAVARQLQKQLRQKPNHVSNFSDVHDAYSLARSLLAAYPDRVARRRQPGSDRGLMVGGRGVRLDRKSQVAESELFLCLDVDSGSPEAIVRAASAIEFEWLDEERIHSEEEYSFDEESGAVVARRVTYFLDLPLREQPIRCQPGKVPAELLADAARRDLTKAFPEDSETVSNFICRARFVARKVPKLGLPELDESQIDEVLQMLCQSRTSLAELRRAPWLDHLRGLFDYQQLQQIDEHAPARMTVPSGNAIRVHYQEDQPPRMEVRIQELFGWQENPRVAGGRVPIQLHLLGPNYRPQQITEDLENFWRSTYDHVRKELRGRYPKHHWPEHPASAVATRNGLKPRKGS